MAKQSEYYQTGDYIKIRNVDNLFKDAVKESLFQSGSRIGFLKAIVSLSEKKSYKVTDVCESCRSLTIKVKEKLYISIDFKDITKDFDKKIKKYQQP